MLCSALQIKTAFDIGADGIPNFKAIGTSTEKQNKTTVIDAKVRLSREEANAC